MFADLVGYTGLGQMNESLRLPLADEQRKLITPLLTRHNGREVKIVGDAFFVEFSKALDALMCAYDVQRATRAYNFSLPEERKNSPAGGHPPRRRRRIRGATFPATL